MTMLVGVFQMLLAILALSGLTKVVRPAQAGAALVAARLVPGPINRRYKTSHLLGRLLGLTELGVATAGFAAPLLWTSSWFSAAIALCVAVTFGGFNWFIRRLTTIDPNASCGCFGDTSAPPGAIHKALNWIAVSVASVMTLTIITTDQLPAAAVEGFAEAVPYVAAITIGCVLFLKGPSLAADLDAAIATENHSHSHAPTFAISQDLLSQNAQPGRRVSRGKRS